MQVTAGRQLVDGFLADILPRQLGVLPAIGLLDVAVPPHADFPDVLPALPARGCRCHHASACCLPAALGLNLHGTLRAAS